MTKPPPASATSALSRIPVKAIRKAKRATRRLLARPGADAAVESGSGSRRFLEPIPPRLPTEPPGPTILLLNDCRDQVNFGSRALVEGLLEILGQRVPTATILPIPSHWMLGVADPDPYVDRGRGFAEPRVTYPYVADEFEATADAWLSGRGGRDVGEFLDRIEAADLLLLNGEGSIYRDNRSAMRELFLLWLAKERLGTPAVFVNGGVHLTDVFPLVPAMVRRTFPLLDAVAVREPFSLRNVNEYLPDVPARLFPDAAFVFVPDEARETAAVADARRRVGPSPYFVFDPGPMPMDRQGPDSALYRLITEVKGGELQAVLVCKDPTDAYLAQVAADTGSVFVDTLDDFREYMALAAGAQFSVSGRYHNTILAAIMGCPTVAFGSASHKVHGACELLEGEVGAPFDATYFRPSLDAIVEQTRGYVHDRDGSRARLQEICGRRRAEALGLGDLVGDLLGTDAPS